MNNIKSKEILNDCASFGYASETKMADEQQKTDAISYEETLPEEGISGELEKVRGVVSSRKTNIRITENDPDWLAGKEKGDKAAADRFAEKFWSEEHTRELRKQIENPENTLFISVPSSSKKNVHPVSLAEKLFQEFGGKFVTGETYFDVLHERQSKKIGPFERVFHPRIYEPVNSKILKAAVGDREVIVTDDIFTTGGSAASLIRAPDRMGISVKAVTGYFGNTKLAVPPQIISSMHKALKNAGIPVKARELAKHLTFEEAKIIIELAKKAGSENEKTELTRKLQGISDR
ncbi:phosphoribosyltransferase [Desulfonema magnum]|uniref:Phosphoribosyltransferase-like domain-containing protein n=1 Tax=Desulfonema magnum TaxID=45655 RepID=A0A975BFQ0_9BACT|nr:phosphoribosyltransferase [Desulfonema magnum]QTA84438.1 phosphoribosyltransferase-like domain-containing protein [Desulfonema magnum]